MKMAPYPRREIAIKIAFISLVLLLSGNLFAYTAMASEDCGMNSPADMQFFGENSNLCKTCCCLGDAQCVCPTQCSQPVEMPVVVLVSNGSLHSGSYSLTLAPVKTLHGMHYPEGGLNFPSSKKAVALSPLFLLNQSFII